MERIAYELGVRCDVEVREDESGLHVECRGGEVGALIGRFGQTIDAIQYLVNAIVAKREGERVEVTIDAEGYRERRREMLERLAVRSAERVLESGEAGRARPDERGRAEGRAPASPGRRGRRDVERGHGAEPLRRRQPRLSAGSRLSSRRPG